MCETMCISLEMFSGRAVKLYVAFYIFFQTPNEQCYGLLILNLTL